MYKLKDKVAVVTGAAGGNNIGKAIAMRFAKEGAKLVVSDYKHEQALTRLVAEVQALGSECISVMADITNEKEVEGLIANAVAQFGGVNILVNCAASEPSGDRCAVVDMKLADFERVLSTNATGAFICCREFANQAIKQGEGGKIINLSSIYGKRGKKHLAAYSASKFALLGLTESLALELAEHAINVNAICPGPVDTDRLRQAADLLHQAAPHDHSPAQTVVKDREQAIPLGKVASVDDIANVAAFLASPESDYLTGTSIDVCGGLAV